MQKIYGDFKILNEVLKKIQDDGILTDEDKKNIKEVLPKYIDDVLVYLYIDIIINAIGEKEFAESIYKMDSKEGIGVGDTPIRIFKNFGDKDYLTKLILDPEFHFTSYQKQLLLEEIGDKELIERFIRDPSLGLEAFHRSMIIENLYGNDIEKLKEYLLDNTLEIESEIKTRWIIKINDKDLTERFIRDSSLNLEGIDKSVLIIKICGNDEEKEKKYLFDDSIELDSKGKTELILEINDPELTKRYIDGSLGIENSDKVRLILELCQDDIEKIKEYIFSDSLKLEKKDIIYLIDELTDETASKIIRTPNIDLILDLKSRIVIADKIEDISYIKEKIKEAKTLPEKIELMDLVRNEDLVYEFLKKNISKTQSFTLLQLIRKIRTPERLMEFKDIIEKQDKSGELIKHLAENLEDPDLLYKWNEEHIEIEHVTELSVEDLEKNPKIKYIIIKGYVNEYYSYDEFLNIRRKIDEAIENIEKPKKGDAISELRAFKQIFKRLSHITYDEYAITKEGEQDSRLVRTCRNLYGGLIEGTCVCKGYARILEECCLCLGLEINTIGGEIEPDKGHAWNQIKIGEKWFNCDLTNYRHLAFSRGGINIYQALQSNDEFEDYNEYYLNENQEVKICNTRIKEMILGEYVKKMARHIGINEVKETFKKLQERVKKIKNQLLYDKETEEER